jgi:hypothetical protein
LKLFDKFNRTIHNELIHIFCKWSMERGREGERERGREGERSALLFEK